MKRGIIAVAVVLLGFVFPGVANAETPPGCSSAAQIGSTAYVKYRGNNIASVKQFAGCGSNYSYVYMWESFRNSGHHWITQTAVAVYSSASDSTPDSHKGGSSNPYDPKELWSKPADTLDKCTAAYGLVSVAQDDNFTAYTGKRC
ncbi:hypothetical protein [Lentzea sp. NPDC004782]|uniref:hypothetical protein n=1 Tax=Lentzea sp. NPDC004782 TaxID=3154458 RepID=UPI0033B6E118